MRLVICASALGALLACGHYGPPERGDRDAADDSARVVAPVETPAECEDKDEKKQETEP